MSWVIYRRWATNTTSRHAFYQTFFIAPDHITGSNPSGVCIQHYGKLTTEMERQKRPSLGGQVLVTRGGKDWVDSKMNAKLNGSYVIAAAPVKLDFPSEVELRTWITQTFGASKREEILLLLSLKAGTEPGIIAEPIAVTEDAPYDDGGAAELEELLRGDDRRGTW